MDFSVFKVAVAAQFERMQKHALFRVDVDKNLLWETYLGAFPIGTNPIFRERTEHDCTCCKQFIRTVGDVVAIIDNKVVSIWDVPSSSMAKEPAYGQVTAVLAALVRSRRVKDVFFHYESSAGTSHNFEQLDGDDRRTQRWDHFHVSIPAKFVMAKDGIATKLGTLRADHDVFQRSLDEITPAAVTAVLELIEQNVLYRGAEHKATVATFQGLQSQYGVLPLDQKANFAWSAGIHGAVARIRNTSIGTLLVDLSEDIDLEIAVKKYEVVVAPANYKRPTALITPSMVNAAMETIRDLSLETALERRFANMSDITINNVLWADRSAKKKMKGGLEDVLMAAAVKKRPEIEDQSMIDIAVDRFLIEVLPTATGMEIFVGNSMANNFMSLTAPTAPLPSDPAPLFKWPNEFAWSYNGELADSDMRKAVQARGGSVTGVFRFTHQWNYAERNASLMDLHVFMPGSRVDTENGVHDNYGNAERVGWNARKHSRSGGVQDVDYVNAAPAGYVPVENITFPSLGLMPEGRYICKIHNWALRAPTQGGFKAEIEFGGQIFQYEVTRPLKNKEWITVAEVTLKAGVFEIKHHLPCGQASRSIWSVDTESFAKVDTIMLSPNFWDDNQVGNKHWFFMLAGCKNDNPTRGIYNEFLHPALDKHRKVFEILGSKTMCQPTPQQLSGLGFSSTQRNTVICRVEGASRRTYKVTI